MNASQTSTSTAILTLPAIASSHGKPSTASVTKVMDVDHERRRHSRGPEDKGVMDTTVDLPQKDVAEDEKPEAPAKGEAETVEQPALTLERRRESDDGVKEATSQMASVPQQSHLTQNLLSSFGLDPLAATVARTDPVTGEKINKMRKSYEGQLKTLGLAGRNKATKHDESKGMGLWEMAQWPAEEWHNQKVMGKDVANGLPESTLAKLEKAMQMQAGPVPNNNEWEDILGIDKAKPVDPAIKNGKQAFVAKANGQPNGAPSSNANSPNTEPIRSRRTTKKRRYDEHSFEGYGEGYLDDEMDIGYTSGETHISRNSASKKRRKTKDYSNSPTDFGSHNNNFNAGPIGISAYGR